MFQVPRRRIVNRTNRKRFRKSTRRGLSLLEVVLALAILAMTAALLSQLTRQATDNAIASQRQADAQILCESTMAEILAGAIPMQSTDWTPIQFSTRPGNWHYRLESSATERQDMLGLRLGITDDPQKTTMPVELFYVVRWVIDPNLGLDVLPEQTDAAGASGSTTSGGATTAGGLQ